MTVPASDRRSCSEDLQSHLEVVSRSPVIKGLLEAVPGVLAILNEHRQILVVNDIMLSALGIEDGGRLLGLRPGEAVECIHAHEEAAGCGTSRFCPTCGAAIAIVSALGSQQPAERECAISVQREGRTFDLYLSVRCAPIHIEDQRFLLLFLRDISIEQHRAALEGAFYHDISNLVESLSANCRLLDNRGGEPGSPETAPRIIELASRLAREIKIQKILARGPGDFQPSFRALSAERLLERLRAIFGNHWASRHRTLLFAPTPDLILYTDPSLAERVLMNLLTNALEATGEGGVVRIWVEEHAEAVALCVGNQNVIPQEVAPPRLSEEL